ncbi:hypothetical protein [Streptomyces sp. MNU89]|uniref:hypothetical protein n=1 Tax=Streptomyces sp. MNU89 TaxID=2560025 RepID=UPI001E3EFA3F|nr:hypothetical protein [Streptomyces sp. MNU89]MCC9738519.1 hypothetical protein [Streptomyces sp. MNU89]
MLQHRLSVLVPGGVGGGPDGCEGFQQVGAEDAGDRVLQGCGLVRVEDSGVPAGEEEPGCHGGLPPVGEGLAGEVLQDQGGDGGSQVAAVSGAAAEVGAFGAGFLQDGPGRVQGRAAQRGRGDPPAVRGVRGLVGEGAPGGRVAVLVPGPQGVDGGRAQRGEEGGVDLQLGCGGVEGGRGAGAGADLAGDEDVLASGELRQALAQGGGDAQPLPRVRVAGRFEGGPPSSSQRARSSSVSVTAGGAGWMWAWVWAGMAGRSFLEGGGVG